MADPDADFDALLEEMGTLQDELDAANAWDLDSQFEQAMDALRCPPADAAVNHLSGGERRRVALCKLLLEAPDLLLLDEPTNHLDAECVLWLERHLAAYKGAVIAVTHDRYFLDNVAQWIAEVDRGQLYPYEGNYSTYLETKKARLEIQGKKDAKLAKRLKDELEWVRASAKGRQAKNKARLARYEEMAAEAERTRKLDFEEIQIPPGPRLGTEVLEAPDLKKGFGDRVLIDGLSFTLPRTASSASSAPTASARRRCSRWSSAPSPSTRGPQDRPDRQAVSYVDQNRAGIDPKKTVWEVVSDGLDYIKVGNFEMPSRAYVASFGFKGPDQQKLAGVLSGGERNRLNLALTLKQGGNLLLLDEPTNDLDVETLPCLENALLEFPGCAVVISHDRWFLDRVATHILAWEGTDENEANWYWFEGNFAAYEENKIERLGPDAARPHASKHRRLTRDEPRRAAPRAPRRAAHPHPGGGPLASPRPHAGTGAASSDSIACRPASCCSRERARSASTSDSHGSDASGRADGPPEGARAAAQVVGHPARLHGVRLALHAGLVGPAVQAQPPRHDDGVALADAVAHVGRQPPPARHPIPGRRQLLPRAVAQHRRRARQRERCPPHVLVVVAPIHVAADVAVDHDLCFHHRTLLIATGAQTLGTATPGASARAALWRTQPPSTGARLIVRCGPPRGPRRAGRARRGRAGAPRRPRPRPPRR